MTRKVFYNRFRYKKSQRKSFISDSGIKNAQERSFITDSPAKNDTEDVFLSFRYYRRQPDHNEAFLVTLLKNIKKCTKSSIYSFILNPAFVHLLDIYKIKNIFFCAFIRVSISV